MEVKVLKTDYLPHLASQQVKVNTSDVVTENKLDKKSKDRKNIKPKFDELNPQTENLQKEFNKELEKLFLKDNQQIIINKDTMNVSEGVKPTYGVSLREGREINITGPEYRAKLPK